MPSSCGSLPDGLRLYFSMESIFSLRIESASWFSASAVLSPFSVLAVDSRLSRGIGSSPADIGELEGHYAHPAFKRVHHGGVLYGLSLSRVRRVTRNNSPDRSERDNAEGQDTQQDGYAYHSGYCSVLGTSYRELKVMGLVVEDSEKIFSGGTLPVPFIFFRHSAIRLFI